MVVLAQLVRVPDCGSGGHGVVAHTLPLVENNLLKCLYNRKDLPFSFVYRLLVEKNLQHGSLGEGLKPTVC